MRRLAAAPALAAVVAVLALVLTSCSPPRSYVALGDSYSAGPLIPVQDTHPLGCLRSDHNFAHLTRAQLHLPVFRDVSCSGATTEDMTSSQSVFSGPNPPPQLDALDANTAAVSLTISGNDIGFTSIIENCISAKNEGTPCQDQYVVGGHDTLRDRVDATAPKVAAVLTKIRARAPRAKVFLLGYLAILPEHGGCYPQIPVTDGDVPYLRSLEKYLNGMLRQQATANKATYVDAYTPSIGHDACQLSPLTRYVEPLAPVNPAAPVHPNLAGMKAYARVLLAAMR
ncbi:MAG: family lipase, partial [Acidimicrobiales bacterium]|nr:family lipase [Acidimicrobiales bacterium]